MRIRAALSPTADLASHDRRICATDALIKHGELTASVDSHQIAHIVGQQ
jgi:hypothetical protein